MKAMIAALMVLSAAIGARAEETPFVVAVANEKSVRTTGKYGWNLEIGEVFLFIRYMSASEFAGGPADLSDSTYAVLQIDQDMIVVHTKNIKFCPKEDTPKMALAYGQLVKEGRASEEAHEQKQAQQRAEELTASRAQQEESQRQAQFEAQKQAEEQAQIQEEEAGAFRPQTFYVSYAIYPPRDVQYNDGFILRRGTQLSAKWDREADTFSYIDSNGTPRQLPARLAREVPSHRLQADPNREAYIRRRDQAIMAGASKAELNEIENQYLSTEELRQIRGELQSIRQSIPAPGVYRHY